MKIVDCLEGRVDKLELFISRLDQRLAAEWYSHDLQTLQDLIADWRRLRKQEAKKP